MAMVSVKMCVAAAGVFAALAASPGPDPVRLTVHEWGTFTSIAGENGGAVPWRPLSGPPELPSFVIGSRVQRKSDLTATVRMETPVLYFYAPQEAVLDVSVRFHQGLFTEYFPRASSTPDTISWSKVRIQPGVTPSFPTEAEKSHYYAARHTDAFSATASPCSLGLAEREIVAGVFLSARSDAVGILRSLANSWTAGKAIFAIELLVTKIASSFLPVSFTFASCGLRTSTSSSSKPCCS